MVAIAIVLFGSGKYKVWSPGHARKIKGACTGISYLQRTLGVIVDKTFRPSILCT